MPRVRRATPGWFWVVVGAAVAVALSARAVLGQEGRERRSTAFDSALAAATVDSAWGRIVSTYHDTTFGGHDWPAVGREARERAARARDAEEVRAAIRAMFDRLGQSHFALIPAESADGWGGADGEERAAGDVGLELRLLDGRVVVWRVAEGSPAAARGVTPGWWVTRIGDLDVAAFARDRLAVHDPRARRLAELQLPLGLMARLHGPVGDSLRVEFRDATDRAVVLALPWQVSPGETVRFGHLPPQRVRFATHRYTGPGGCVGVIRFNVWMTPVMPRIDDAMRDFERCRALVFDLRGNVGGVAAMVMGVGGYLLDSVTTVGTMTTRGGALSYMSTPRRSDRRGMPLAPFAGEVAILVDALSVSTSEIFAAALQVLGRARVFGEPTAGQALPSMIARLPNGDLMQHVVADFTIPGGRRVEALGVTPDELVALDRRSLLSGRDDVMDAALAWIDERVAAAMAVGGPGVDASSRPVRSRPPSGR